MNKGEITSIILLDYSDIYEIYFKNFLKEPVNTTQILKQSLSFNSHISSKPDIEYIIKWSMKGINQIKVIIDKNGNLMSHDQLKKYITLQLHS